METITNAALRRLVGERRAEIVEVLPSEEYDDEHIAGAVNIPLKGLEEGVAELDRSRPVIVYCNSFL